MYCAHCGTPLNDDVKFCHRCGAAVMMPPSPAPSQPPVQPQPPQPPAQWAQTQYQQYGQPQPPQPAPGPVGFSPRINDPAFAAYQKKSGSWALIFSLILAVVAIVGFPIYGNASGEIDFPQSLYYGLGIGGMFVLIAVIQVIRRNTDKTWDGVVADKRTYRRIDNSQDDTTTYRTIYEVKVRRDGGGMKTHTWSNTPGLYDYYNTGDRVRHHNGFAYYEKYDKSADTHILCAACLTMNDKAADRCSRCKCPLLK